MSQPPAKRPRIVGKMVQGGNIDKIGPLIPPACLVEEIPMPEGLADVISIRRQQVADCMNGTDDRLVVIIGPCSVHDVVAAKEYATKLKAEADKYLADLHVVMRVYFEKPRTTVGWKGLINDPDLDGTFKINKGLKRGRNLLVEINTLGLGCAVEFLDTISPQYIADLVSWGAIGARTTESQTHRELASGLSMPIGFKNGTGGDTQVAIDAIKAAGQAHRFLGVTAQGLAAIVHTKGNPHTHIILRGGKTGPNYDAESVAKAAASLEKAGVDPAIMIDCSHANSQKKHKNQPIVAADIAKQLAAGDTKIRGVMVESHLSEGAQKLDPGKTDPSSLKYGVSVTDACIHMADTVVLLEQLATAVQARRATVAAAGGKK